MKKGDCEARIRELLKELHLPGIRECFIQKAQEFAKEQMSHQEYLRELLEHECCLRREKSIQRRLRESNLPLEKTFEAFDIKRLGLQVSSKVKGLREGGFVDRRENVLAFGQPGSGKTHLLAAIGQELVKGGRQVYFAECSILVQQLLRAKAALMLDKHLKKLARFDVLVIDDIGYVQQSRDEMEVLFTLLAARYERGSVMITSNLAFSKWEAIFKDPMTTAAAIDRLVHHSVILELTVPSYRMEQAKRNKSDRPLETDKV